MDDDMAGRDFAVHQVEDALARLDLPAGKTPVRQLPGEAPETGTPPGRQRGLAPDGRIFAARDRAGKASAIIPTPVARRAGADDCGPGGSPPQQRPRLEPTGCMLAAWLTPGWSRSAQAGKD